MEAEEKAEYFSYKATALRKSSLLLHPSMFHPISSTIEKWADFTEREREMSVTDEKVIFVSTIVFLNSLWSRWPK